MSGWIKLHREIFDSDIWHDVTTFRLFVYLIGKASHQDGLNHKGMILNKGQYVRSYRKLADDLSYKEGRGFKKYSLNTIKKCVHKLIEAERVNVKETELGTLFTIVNYAKYQDFSEFEKETENGLSDEPRTNGELMVNEVRTRSRIKELKNYKEDDDHTRMNPFSFFEQEGFGTLSGTIADNLGDLIDTYGEDLVIHAMKEAVLYGARNLKYVQRILANPNSKRGGNSGKKVQQYRGSNGTPERKDSILGGQVGWIKPNRKSI